MLEGICPKCGLYRVGWALRNARHQTCPKCGVGLEIMEDGHRLFTGYSPFDVEKYLINPSSGAPSAHDIDNWNAG